MGFLASLRSAAAALCVGIGGAALAWIGLKQGLGAAAAVCLLFAGIGAFSLIWARVVLDRDPPDAKSAVGWYETAVVLPGVIAAAVSGLLVWVAIDRTTKSTSPEDKALIAAAVAAVTTFLTTAFVDWSKDSDTKMVASWVESAFKKRFENVFKPLSDAQLAAQDNLRYGGWGRAARRERAEVIEARWNEDRK